MVINQEVTLRAIGDRLARAVDLETVLSSTAEELGRALQASGVCIELGLESAIAVQARAEDYEPGRSFDTVIARALASIKKIIELGGHLAAANGVVLALKGQYPAAELEQLEIDDWETLSKKGSICFVEITLTWFCMVIIKMNPNR